MRLEFSSETPERDPSLILPRSFREWLKQAKAIMGYEYRKAAGKQRKTRFTLVIYNARLDYTSGGAVTFTCLPEPTLSSDVGFWFDDKEESA